jgi:putative ATPase
VSENFLPDELKGTVFYEPGINPKEDDIRKKLSGFWKDVYKYEK